MEQAENVGKLRGIRRKIVAGEVKLVAEDDGRPPRNNSDCGVFWHKTYARACIRALFRDICAAGQL